MEFEFMEVFLFLFFDVLATLIVISLFMALLDRFYFKDTEYVLRVKPWALLSAKFLHYLGYLMFLPIIISFIQYATGSLDWVTFAYNSFFVYLPLIIMFMMVRSFLYVMLGSDGSTPTGGSE